MKKLVFVIAILVTLVTAYFTAADCLNARTDEIKTIRTELTEVRDQVESYISDTRARFEQLEADNAELLADVEKLRDEVRVR